MVRLCNIKQHIVVSDPQARSPENERSAVMQICAGAALCNSACEHGLAGRSRAKAGDLHHSALTFIDVDGSPGDGRLSRIVSVSGSDARAGLRLQVEIGKGLMSYGEARIDW